MDEKVMSKYFIRLFCSFYFVTCFGMELMHEKDQKIDCLDSHDIEKLSFYQGYSLYHKHVQQSDIPFDFEQMVKGMDAAHNKEQVDFQDEIFQNLLERVQKHLLKKIERENLEQANLFLSKLALEDKVIPLVKDKLYYKILREGEGLKIDAEDSPLLFYTSKSLLKGKESPGHGIEEPKKIFLKSTISGFAQGVTGMKEGEKRVIYIHPDLAYGVTCSRAYPNSLMIFEVEVVTK